MMLGPVRGGKRATVSPFAAVLDQGEFRSELGRLCVSEWHWGAPQAVRIQPLKWHRERCTCEITVKTETGCHGVIGKVYEVDQAGVFRTRETVWQAGFGPEAEFSIPQPLAYLPSVRVLLEEKVQGPSAKETLLSGIPHERRAAGQRCGQWLARFHTADPGRDVAWFVVSLQRLALVHLGSFHALDGPAQHFQESYLSAGNGGVPPHYPFYRALECLHRARRDLYKRVPPVPEWAEIMLD